MAYLNSTFRNIEKNQEKLIKLQEKEEKNKDKLLKEALKTAKIEVISSLKAELEIAYKTYDYETAFNYNNKLINRNFTINKILNFYDNELKFFLDHFINNNYLKLNKQLYIIYKNDFLFQQEEANKNNIDSQKNDQIKISDFLYYLFKTLIIILIFPLLILLFLIK